MPLTFRPAEPGDIPLLRDLATRIWRACYADLLSPAQIEYMLGWMYAAEKIAQELADGVLWEMAMLGDLPAGYLALSSQPSDIAELHKLYLLPEHHGLGHGQAMIAHACALVSARGAHALQLRVNKRNVRALRAYERAGFHIIDSIVADIGGGFVMDDYILTRPLTPAPSPS